ncbi:MAG: glycoside hydrolase family 16 protein [Lachnospiraceae bacterium]|nr:glycoside hydrolase family 16 protein [Lachnospiraceae bacterium]
MRQKVLRKAVAGLLTFSMLPLQLFASGGNVIAAETESVDSSKWKLVWSDEFDGDSLDESKWMYRLGSTYNDEQQYYKKDNVSVSDGTLKITAKSEETNGYPYTSGRISTGGNGTALFATKYGRIEAKIKLPKGTGLWPAFWMMPKDNVYGSWPLSGEIDIMEARGRLTGEVNGGIHFGQSGSNKNSLSDTYTFADGSDITDYHVYAIEWSENEIVWFVDDNEFYRTSNWYTMNDEGVVAEYPAPFDQEFYIILNLAVGGTYDNYKEPSESELPATMEVDYVRVYHDVDGYNEENITMPKGTRDDEAMAATPVFENGNLLSDINFETINESILYANNTDISSHNWYLLTNKYYLGDANTTKSVIDGNTFLNIHILDPGTQAYSVMLAQLLPLAKGYVYKVSFDAYGLDSDKTIKVKAYGEELYSSSYKAKLTNELQHFEFSFLMENETDMNAHLEFDVGQYEGDVSIGNVRVEVLNTYVESEKALENDDMTEVEEETEETEETEVSTEGVIEETETETKVPDEENNEEEETTGSTEETDENVDSSDSSNSTSQNTNSSSSSKRPSLKELLGWLLFGK